MTKLKNLKHEKFCQSFMAGNTQKGAYLEHYPGSNSDSAECNSSRLLKRPDVKQRCLEILEHSEGLKLKAQLDNLAALSYADKSVVVNKMLKQVADNPTRLEATKTILKLYGLLGTEKAMPQVDARQVHVTVNDGNMSQLSNLVEKLSRITERQQKIEGDIINEGASLEHQDG